MSEEADTAVAEEEPEVAQAAAPEPAGEAAPPAEETPPAPSAPENWKDWFGSDHAKLLSAYKTPADLAANTKQLMTEARKKQEGVLRLPKDSSTDEERSEFMTEVRKAMGVPDSPDGYKIEVPEQLPEGLFPRERVGEFAELAHKLGASPELVQGLMNLQAQWTMHDLAGEMKHREETEMKLRAQWGERFAENQAVAAKVAAHVGADLDSLDPGVQNWMAMTGHLLQQDGGIAGTGQFEGPVSNLQRAQQIQETDAYNGKLGAAAQQRAHDAMLEALRAADKAGELDHESNPFSDV
jgi:hypothetical protein